MARTVDLGHGRWALKTTPAPKPSRRAMPGITSQPKYDAPQAAKPARRKPSTRTGRSPRTTRASRQRR